MFYYYCNNSFFCRKMYSLKTLSYLQILKEEEGGRLHKFARYLRLYGKDLQSMLESSPGATVFAPSNEAFNRTAKLLGGEAKLEELLKNQKDAPTILGLHVIDEQIPSTDIRITKPQNFVTCKTCKTKVRDTITFYDDVLLSF